MPNYFSNFQNCCAMNIMYNFDGNYDFYDGDEFDEDQHKRLVREVKKDLKDHAYVGGIVAALNSNQVRYGMGKVLEDVGFEPVGPFFYYPGHGRNIQMYLFTNYPDKVKKNPDHKKVKQIEASVKLRTKKASVKKDTPLRRRIKAAKRLFG